MITEFKDSKSLPIGADSIRLITHRYKPPSEQEIHKYREEYSQWLLQMVKEFFESLPHKMNTSSHHVAISISICNNGNVPAENVIVEFRVLGGLLLKPPPDKNKKIDKKESCKFPLPPHAPEGKWIQQDAMSSMFAMHAKAYNYATAVSVSPMMDFKTIEMIKPRDRQGLYWKHGKPHSYSHSWTFECEEFMHQSAPEVFEITLFLPIAKTTENAALSARISAKNLPKPVEYILPVKVTYNQGDTMKKAWSLLQVGFF